MSDSITITDVTEIRETVYDATKALYTDPKNVTNFYSEKGASILNQVSKELVPIGVSNMSEMFEMIVTEIKKLLDLDIDLDDFMPQRVLVQPLIGEKNCCIVYTESNDIELFVKTQKLVTKFTTMLMVKEDGKWLIDSLVS